MRHRRFIMRDQFIRRIFLGRENRPHHRKQQHRTTTIERVLHRVRNDALCGSVRDAELLEDVRQRRGNHRTDTDEETLHRETGRALFGRQLITNVCTERFHRNVDRRIKHPQHARRNPQHRCVRKKEQRQRRQHRSDREVRTTTTKATPGAVRHVANDWLHQQAGQRRRHPQNWNVIGLRTQRFENPAHIRVLQREPKLNSKETKTHVPDLPEGHSGFFGETVSNHIHRRGSVGIII